MYMNQHMCYIDASMCNDFIDYSEMTENGKMTEMRPLKEKMKMLAASQSTVNNI